MDVYETAEDILNEKGSDILAVSPDSTLARGHQPHDQKQRRLHLD